VETGRSVREGERGGGRQVVQEGASQPRLAPLCLTALGIVFGDIATSPLYAVRECFHGEYGIEVTGPNVLGVLSLMAWALIMIVTVKYLVFVLRADNEGEGGVLALTALLRPRGKTPNVGSGLVPLGVFAACLLYGDGMITPAISVLSAVEGLRMVAPRLREFVVPVTILILAALFILQSRGTARVGRLFGPIILLWLCALGILGISAIVRRPDVLTALNPWHGMEFLLRNRIPGFLVLGAVFLVVTGAEALYADLGHFGKTPIRTTWVLVVLPSLLANYFGQGAFLLGHPEAGHHPFYALVPSWGVLPMVFLATMATIIASQAVITGSFSLTQQAIQLGYLPRMKITHTSVTQMGQIYVSPVNWLLMVCTIGLVVGFRSSSQLAAAYGVAVTSTMVVTTILFYAVARNRWGWGSSQAALVAGIFLVMDLPFLAANASKILHGAWFPLLIGAFFFVLMLTWKQGRRLLAKKLRNLVPTFSDFKKTLDAEPPHRVDGHAIFLSSSPDIVPAALIHNLRHNKILHSEIAFLIFETEDIPRVPNLEKVEIEKLGGGFYRVIARYGFMERPNVAKTLVLAKDKGLEFQAEEVSFFLGREKLSIGKAPSLGRWRSHLFLFMARNAADPVAFFDIPPNQIIEIGVQLVL
jgi:KUP system potassium uptake protein